MYLGKRSVLLLVGEQISGDLRFGKKTITQSFRIFHIWMKSRVSM